MSLEIEIGLLIASSGCYKDYIKTVFITSNLASVRESSNRSNFIFFSLQHRLQKPNCDFWQTEEKESSYVKHDSVAELKLFLYF